jgi:hypothetical protein
MIFNEECDFHLLYSPILLGSHTCVCMYMWSMKNLNFTQKMHKRLRKKKHLRLNIPFSGFSYGNSLYITFASRRTVTWLNSLYNAKHIFWLKSSRISYFYTNVELTLSYNDQQLLLFPLNTRYASIQWRSSRFKVSHDCFDRYQMHLFWA